MNLDEMERRAHKTLNGSRQYIKANATDVLTLIAALREARELLWKASLQLDFCLDIHQVDVSSPGREELHKAIKAWLARFKDD